MGSVIPALPESEQEEIFRRHPGVLFGCLNLILKRSVVEKISDAPEMRVRLEGFLSTSEGWYRRSRSYTSRQPVHSLVAFATRALQAHHERGDVLHTISALRDILRVRGEKFYGQILTDLAVHDPEPEGGDLFWWASAVADPANAKEWRRHIVQAHELFLPAEGTPDLNELLERVEFLTADRDGRYTRLTALLFDQLSGDHDVLSPEYGRLSYAIDKHLTSNGLASLHSLYHFDSLPKDCTPASASWTDAPVSSHAYDRGSLELGAAAREWIRRYDLGQADRWLTVCSAVNGSTTRGELLELARRL